MGIPNDEQFEAAFGELAEAAAVMANPAEASVLRARVRRRRTARAGVAGVAAVAVLSASGWLMQHALGQDTDPPPADDETTAAVEPTPTAEDPTSPAETTTTAEEEHVEAPVLPEFDDLAGTAMDLFSFMPGASIDGICRTDGAELVDGRTGDPMRSTGQVVLLEVVHAPMTDGGQEQAVAFLGCRFAEAAAFQAVLLAEDGNGGWEAAAQLIHSKANADRPYDIAAHPDYGVLIGVAERYMCCAGDPDAIDYWVERAVLDDVGNPVLDRLAESEVPSGFFADLAVTVDAIETADAGVWTLTVTVRNNGSDASGRYRLSGCLDAGIEADADFVECFEGGTALGDIDGLDVGETYTATWTVTVAATGDSAYARFTVEADTRSEPGIVRDVVLADNEAFFDFNA
ncbi:hypothetical protein K3N28_12195 [Glycomyces sp. TRM65418]|uniref:CARDB domain-containing protein n=1 Tax=Glycomyces sp. TRM65418 TaxID=2867006 RepID=UPI001CE583F2|nr:CARDB domain-containing protein [Glycomyces sp. TRM65418]MCC3763826.1 hypothetical protein [Glycomyces sp. TRM65418]QZD53532.1 hypothetical protein K3N28_12125 [Glycomyces sp. TRM65418]